MSSGNYAALDPSYLEAILGLRQMQVPWISCNLLLDRGVIMGILDQYITPLKLMKSFLKLVAFGCAVALGVFLVIYFLGERDQSSDTPLLKNYDLFDLEALEDQQLLVVNVHVEGSEASEKLAVILEKIEANRTFGDRVIVSQVDIEANTGYARDHNVNLTDFRGHLNFFSKDREYKPLKHMVDEQVVLDQIQAYLDGLVRRFDRDWSPPVPGMEHRSAAGTP